MKIGIDVDGVLINFEEHLNNMAELYDLIEVHGNGVINSNTMHVQQKYNWTEKQKNNFMERYFLELSEQASIIPGVKEVIPLLQQEGHELIIISARGQDFEEMIQIVMKKFKETGLSFDKYYWKQTSKVEICQQEKVDIMIEDNYTTCEKLAKNGIFTIYLRDIRGIDIEQNLNIVEKHSWAEIYRYIWLRSGGNKWKKDKNTSEILA